MKNIILTTFALCLSICRIFSQDIPRNPNFTDHSGKKQGLWTILYDKTGYETNKIHLVEIYRIVTFRNDKPVGKVINYYLSGNPQMEADSIISTSPEKYSGKVVYYRPNGKKANVNIWKDGSLAEEINYNKQGQEVEDNWWSIIQKANLALSNDDIKKASELMEKARLEAAKEFGENHEEYAEICTNAGSLQQDLGQFEQAEERYNEAKAIYESLSLNNDSEYASTLDNLGALNSDMGKFDLAESFYTQAKNIREKVLGKAHPDYAYSLNNLALLYYSQGNYDKTEKWLLEAKDLILETHGKEHPDYTNNLNNLAFLYQNQGKYQQAEPLFLEAREITKKIKGKENNDYTVFTNNIAFLYYLQGKYKEAESLFLETKDIQEKIFGTKHPDYATTLNNLGGVYDQIQDLKKAEEYYLKALEIRKEVLGEDHPTYATSLNNVALLYADIEDYIQAEKFLKEALEIKKRTIGTDHPEYAVMSISLGRLFHNLSRFDEARTTLEAAKKVLEKSVGKKHPNYAYACKSMANLYFTTGNYIKAEPLIKEALKIIYDLNGDNSPIYGKYANDLALLYSYQGKNAESEKWYIKSRNITEQIKGKDTEDFASASSNLGVLYHNLGLYDLAKELFLESLKIRENIFGKSHTTYALVSNNLGSLYESLKDYEQAEKYYLEAKKIWEQKLGNKNNEYAFVCNNLAYMYSALERFEEAETLLLEAKQIHAKNMGIDNIDYGLTCQNLAYVYKKTGRTKEAESLLLEARNIITNTFGKKHPYFAKSSNVLGKLYLDQNKVSQAVPYFQQVIENKIEEIRITLPTLTDSQRKDYLQSNHYFFDDYYYFILKAHHKKPRLTTNLFDLQLVLKGILFQSFQKIQNQILGSDNKELIEKFQDWKAQKIYLAKAIQLSNKEQKQQNINIDSLQNKADLLEKELSKESELFAKVAKNKNYTWKDVQAQLKTGEALVEIIKIINTSNQGNNRDEVYAALIITQNTKKQPDFLTLGNVNDLETQYLRNYRNAIQYKLQDNKSYDVYWAAIHQKLQKDNIQKVYISPDGVYHQINLLTILNPKTQQFLIDELEIQLLSSPKDLVEFSNQPTRLNQNFKDFQIHLFGYPQFDKYPNPKADSLKDKDRNTYLLQHLNKQDTTLTFLERGGKISTLPGTKVEVERIVEISKAQNIPSDLYIELDASEENIKSLKSPDILHIATHGFFLANLPEPNDSERSFLGLSRSKYIENPLLRCGLLLAGAEQSLNGKSSQGEDGILTAQEAMNLNLDNTSLVVLSACETGLGEITNGEGVYGLQRAFRQAGAKSVLMSLWTVSDQATRDLMIFFYQNLFDKKQSRRQAFLNAQNNLRKKYPDPYYWGAFVLVGE